MQISRDEWTPLLQKLKDKISPTARKQLLFQMIGELQDISMLNFGNTGIARPADWKILSEKYAREMKNGIRTPNLILKGELLAGFVHTVGENNATLTNLVTYADEHQFGAEYKNLPARPFYPVTRDGEELTPFAEERLAKIVQEHFQV